uniref:Medium-chain acyl-CoA ligase ACSF2, mitochondrial n=1 Tax=Xenopsylla cheopis TaxID=163159 RepID=A0A6M2DGK1_XENCH
MSLRLLCRSTIRIRKNKYNILRCYSIQSSSTGLSYIHNVGSEPLFSKTLGQCVDEAAEKYGDREALVSLHEGLRFTFNDIREQSDQIAAGFHAIGLRPGDRLGIWTPNCSHWYLTMMAAAKAGLILVGLNPAYQLLEMQYCLKKVDIKGIVTQRQHKTQNYYNILVKLAPELPNSEPGELQNADFPNLKTIVIADDITTKGAYKFKDIASIGNASSVEEIAKLKETIEADSPFNIQFTSGTTGEPKATCLTHFSLTNNGYLMGKRANLSEKHHKICVLVPFFHAFGLGATICPALLHGVTLVVPSAAYNAADSLKAIAKEKCTITHATPTMYVDMIAKQKELRCDLESVEIAVTGGAACSPNLVKQMLEELKVKEVRAAYGLTECTAVVFQTYPGDSTDKITDTVGYPQEHLEIKIIDGKGRIVPLGQPGELCVRGYSNMLGYWKEADKTKEIYGRDKWLKTGDQFILHKNGYASIIGRFKEMIIRGGENIFPKEIEDFLNTHPDILETHVIGVPSERLGEEVCAFIRVQDGKTVTKDNIKEFCKDKISHFKVPQYVIEVDSFPKTVSGKIQKFVLKEMYMKESAQILT